MTSDDDEKQVRMVDLPLTPQDIARMSPEELADVSMAVMSAADEAHTLLVACAETASSLSMRSNEGMALTWSVLSGAAAACANGCALAIVSWRRTVEALSGPRWPEPPRDTSGLN